MRLCKIAGILLAMTNSVAFSGVMGPACTAGKVTVPCTKTGWGVNASALYLQPLYTGGLAFIGTVPTTGSDYVTADPSWRGGFQVGFSYYFNPSNDTTVNWYHMDSSSSTQIAEYAFMVPPSLLQRNLLTNIVTLSPNWDAVNLEMGQLAQLGTKTLRLHGGFQYARIATDSVHSTDTSISVATAGDYDGENMQYSGFGPRVGADMAYYFTSAFSAYAKTATAVLVGSRKTSSVRTNTIVGGFVDDFYRNHRNVVSEIDLKLGLQYDHALANSNLSADVGYMWVNYLHPIAQRPAMLSGKSLDASNFGLQGVYAGLKWNSEGV